MTASTVDGFSGVAWLVLGVAPNSGERGRFGSDTTPHLWYKLAHNRFQCVGT